jgi:acetyl-CoA acetyltransferase
LTKLFNNVPVFETGGRGATTAFAERQQGDVLITFEAEVQGIRKQLGADKYDAVIPSVSLLAEFPVAVVDKVADARSVKILASRMATRPPKEAVDAPNAVEASGLAAYEQAGLGPQDMDIAEVHDASVAYELMAWTDLGLCQPGEEQRWAMEGVTDAGGAMPVNRSGGLVGRGHALGASGLAQVHDTVLQLRGEAGDLQLDSDPRTALVQIGGGVVDWLTAASSVHILGRN